MDQKPKIGRGLIEILSELESMEMEEDLFPCQSKSSSMISGAEKCTNIIASTF